MVRQPTVGRAVARLAANPVFVGIQLATPQFRATLPNGLDTGLDVATQAKRVAFGVILLHLRGMLSLLLDL